MAKWRVVWSDTGEEHEIRCRDDAAVLSEVWRLHAAAGTPRVVVEVLREPGGFPSLSLAVGGSESLVTYQATNDPPYFISVGDPSRQAESEPLVHGMQVIEHLGRNVVPWAVASAALQEFLKAEERPNGLAWESL